MRLLLGRCLAFGLALAAAAAPGDTRAAARAFDPPLFVESFYRWHGVTAQTRVAASGREVWVAAAEGLRRYDLERGTLGRPAAVPPGRATAVVAGAGSVWAAVDGRLHRRAGGVWRREAHPDLGEVAALALDGAELWVAGTRGLFHRSASGGWRRVAIGFPGASGEGAGLVSAAGGVAWAFAYASSRTGMETAFVRIAAGRVERFGYPQGPALTIPSILAAQPDGSVVVATGNHQGAALEGGQLQRFDGSRWSVRPGCTGGAGCLGAADGARVWVLDGGALRADPPSPSAPPGPLPAELGQFVGAVATEDGLFVLGEQRLGRWRDGRWTVFGAPMPGGTSRERAIPDRGGFHPGVGPALAPGPGEAPVAEAPHPEPRPTARIAGVPVLPEYPPSPWNTAGADDAGFLSQLLPDLEPGETFRLTGVYVAPGEGKGAPALAAVASPMNVLPLAAPLPIAGGEAGPKPDREARALSGPWSSRLAQTLVTIEARVALCDDADGSQRACFEAVGAPLRTRSLASAVEAAKRFEHRHVDALRAALIPKGHRGSRPTAYLGGDQFDPYYDGARDRVLVRTWTRTEGGWALDVGYLIDDHDAVEAVVGTFSFVGE